MQTIKKNLIAILILNLASIIWAANIVLGRMLGEYVGPWFIMCSRTLIGGSLFLLILMSMGTLKKLTRLANMKLIILMSLTGVIGFQALLYYGLRWTTPINTSLISASTPLVTVLLSALMLKDKISPGTWIAIFISVIGVAIILSNGQLSTFYALSFNLGDVLIFIAVISWAIYSVVGKIVMQDASVLQVTAMAVFISIVVTLPLGYWETTLYIIPEINTFVIYAILFVGVGPTVISLFFWNKGLQLIGPSNAALYMNTIPVYTILLSFLFLDGKLFLYQMFGMLLIVGSSLFVGLGQTSLVKPSLDKTNLE